MYKIQILAPRLDCCIRTDFVSTGTEIKRANGASFFKGAVYEITFNLNGNFSNTQLAMLYDLPSADNLSKWKRLK